MKKYHYDAHCHIFTVKYILKDAKRLLYDVLKGTYPWIDPNSKELVSKKRNWKEIKSFLRQLYELVRAASGSEEENLNFLQTEAKRSFPSDELCIVPLMMDVFYMLAYPLDKGQDTVEFKFNETIKVDENQFQEKWNEILDDLVEYIESPNASHEEIDSSATNNNLVQVLQMIESERSVKFILNEKNISPNSTKNLIANVGFYQTNGFCYHMDKLMDLVKKRKGELFPFIAVDPRRPGMIKELLTGSFFKGESRFYGVKLYPRMGYHPQSKPMDAVYKYCSDNNLPITFHCGKSGFPSGADWKYADFGNPIHFEEVVKKYPNLKINFAHLGSSDPSLEWASIIVKLVNENENVYSDLSCYTSIKELDDILDFWKNNPKLKDRLMFGTDFDVMYFTGAITMQKYYDNFKQVFSKDELNKLMHLNPTNFMSIRD